MEIHRRDSSGHIEFCNQNQTAASELLKNVDQIGSLNNSTWLLFWKQKDTVRVPGYRRRLIIFHGLKLIT